MNDEKKISTEMPAKKEVEGSKRRIHSLLKVGLIAVAITLAGGILFRVSTSSKLKTIIRDNIPCRFLNFIQCDLRSSPYSGPNDCNIIRGPVPPIPPGTFPIQAPVGKFEKCVPK